MRVQVRADQVSRFNTTAVWTAGKLALAGVGSLVLGVSAVRAAGAMRVEERVARPKAGPIIVARPLDASRAAEVESSVGSGGSQ